MFYDFDTTATVNIDCQKSFTPLCPDELPVPDGHTIVEALNEQAKYTKYHFASLECHPSDAIWFASPEHPQLSPIEGDYPDLDVYWNRHCIVGAKGWEILDGLPSLYEYDFVAFKGMFRHMHPYGACYHDLREQIHTGLIRYLREAGVQTTILGGLAENFCVATTAIQLKKAGFNVFVNLSACRPIGDPTEKRQEMTSLGIKLMAECKIENMEW